jgi:nickel transport protein
MNRLKLIYLIPLVLLGFASAAFAHEVGLRANVRVQSASGETVTYTAEDLPSGVQVTAIEIVAYYSTGEPMADCQVQIFSPDDRTVPWETGRCNAQGNYRFTPDLSKRGRWTVRVASPGHSNFIDILL